MLDEAKKSEKISSSRYLNAAIIKERIIGLSRFLKIPNKKG
jgi:hypothetical protein